MHWVNFMINRVYKESDAKELLKKIEGVLKMMFEEYNSTSLSGAAADSSSTQTRSNIIDDVVHIDDFERMLQREMEEFEAVEVHGVLKSELDKYLDDECEKMTQVSFDILYWWKTTGSKYLTLSRMARDVLAIPASTVASESAFSTGGRVVDHFRSSLTPKLIEALICTQDWIRKGNPPIFEEKEFEDLEKLEEASLVSDQ
ncbi:Zinc finger BED domain-containing protein DAYSLEEPER [Striga hermonthica]|uniref:Zinc finger BED domain-containing protein DAYSLEEPER n=1 Tax=Striga hermonthica TaxID=68872 RepID=A0A9N7P0Z1_STRHE|nr:Zinc finger BED domain-containing protein DAYSLEEPER [Striga hermonthica]